MVDSDQLTGACLRQQPDAGSWLPITAMLTDLAFETDSAGRFTAFGTAQALGYPVSALLGTELAALLTVTDGQAHNHAGFAAIFAAIRAGGVAWHGQLQLTGADGASRHYHLALAPRLQNGVAEAVYGILFDLQAAGIYADRDIAAETGAQSSRMLDAETGLWTAKVFANELARRFDRLDVEEHPGTLLLLGFNRARVALHGPVAMRLVAELRDIVRPADLMGRLDATTIALWCDGMDHLTGAERAARFCGQFPDILPERTTITAGLMTRWPGIGDDPHTVTERASVALRLADLASQRPIQEGGLGVWRVWQAD